ncbi:hypothetical protein CAPTEDRAFT_228572 [Capitella teleta]|uniref:Uncharacterized protein n=1 Tax=Capitella teleta TaxID=283909 RepID=R7V6V8_CAPTE|nr:hypothetical protein CAPTEDRAFT_228572 [Capitella teleta]|eukprot:ELU14299.1 hypothetical protein CAPTEDRAFT_228572 [Capitella teleta]
MPINASSTLNIQLMLQQGLQGIRLQGPTPSSSASSSASSSLVGVGGGGPTPSFQLQRQASETSSSGSTNSNRINTEAEVYAQINNIRRENTYTTTSVNSGTSTDEMITPPPPPPPPQEPIYSSTSCSTQTQTDLAEEEEAVTTHSPSSPPIPTRQYLPPEFGSDSGKGSMPEAGDDMRSLQSGSSGGECSELSLDFMPNGTEASTFEFQDHENIGPVAKQRPCRVGMVVIPGAALMVKMTINEEEFCDDPTVLDLLADITDVCWKEIRQQAKHEMINLTGQQLGKLKVRNNRACAEDVSELSQKLGVDIELSEGIFRRYEDTSNCHVANYMYEIVKTRGGCTLGKTGVVICLRKRNKYAPVDAFCEQLCEHIAIHKPRWVGKVDLSKVNKQNQQHLKALSDLAHKGFLLPQTFQFDPTINVAEAAKRSFVELLDFVHFYY